MQSSMELEPQNGSVGTGEISKEGYEELHRIGDKLKKEMRGLYQTDMRQRKADSAEGSRRL